MNIKKKNIHFDYMFGNKFKIARQICLLKAFCKCLYI